MSPRADLQEIIEESLRREMSPFLSTIREFVRETEGVNIVTLADGSQYRIKVEKLRSS